MEKKLSFDYGPYTPTTPQRVSMMKTDTQALSLSSFLSSRFKAMVESCPATENGFTRLLNVENVFWKIPVVYRCVSVVCGFLLGELGRQIRDRFHRFWVILGCFHSRGQLPDLVWVHVTEHLILFRLVLGLWCFGGYMGSVVCEYVLKAIWEMLCVSIQRERGNFCARRGFGW